MTASIQSALSAGEDDSITRVLSNDPASRHLIAISTADLLLIDVGRVRPGDEPRPIAARSTGPRVANAEQL